MINILKIENLKLVSERFLKMYIQFGYAGSGSMPVTTFRRQNAPAEMYLPQKDRMLSV